MPVSTKSNITIAPNIYVRTAQTLQTDEAFIKSVYGHKALNILKSRFPKSYATRLSRAQVEEMKQNVICRASKIKEHAYGKALVDGKTVWSCRCEQVNCHAYERCMALPNAMRINRGANVEEEEVTLLEDEYGFDHDRISFEPADQFDEQIVSIAETNKDLEYSVYPYTAEKIEFNTDIKTLVICADTKEAGYFSTVLYQRGIKHRLLCSEGYTLNRRIADVFWDYCGEEIEKDAFLDRYFVRVGGSDEEALEFYNALYEMFGESDTNTLKINALADALSGSGAVSEHMLNMDNPDSAVTVTIPDILDGEYDQVLLLESEKETPEIHGVDAIIKKENPLTWVFLDGFNNRACRVSPDNYKGEQVRCMNVELGLWGDVDGKSFLAEETGDAVRLQLYIAEKVKEGHELIIEKNAVTGGYSFYHNGNVLGGFPDQVIREIWEIEGFPDDFAAFEGVFVKNIVTCVGDKDDLTIPARFRESRIWLGLEITGYAKIKI
ncbi:MAG: hypothetical protein FWD34_00180 [Oscillospiraceae bacterium]|nr:hypothetical protein [Oscillospiraceae bacterium]